PFSSVETQKRAPTVSHHSDDANAPEHQCGSFSASQQPDREQTLSDVTDQANRRSPSARHTADVTKTRILRPDFGDVDAASQERDLRERNGTNQKGCEKFQNQTHWLCGCDSSLRLRAIALALRVFKAARYRAALVAAYFTL